MHFQFIRTHTLQDRSRAKRQGCGLTPERQVRPASVPPKADSIVDASKTTEDDSMKNTLKTHTGTTKPDHSTPTDDSRKTYKTNAHAMHTEGGHDEPALGPHGQRQAHSNIRARRPQDVDIAAAAAASPFAFAAILGAGIDRRRGRNWRVKRCLALGGGIDRSNWRSNTGRHRWLRRCCDRVTPHA